MKFFAIFASKMIAALAVNYFALSICHHVADNLPLTSVGLNYIIAAVAASLQFIIYLL